MAREGYYISLLFSFVVATIAVSSLDWFLLLLISLYLATVHHEDNYERPQREQREEYYSKPRYKRKEYYSRPRYERYERNHYELRRGSTGYYEVRHGNHDHEKRQYSTEAGAEDVIIRMRGQGKDPEGTLRAYYNPDYGMWFVGNSNWSECKTFNIQVTNASY